VSHPRAKLTVQGVGEKDALSPIEPKEIGVPLAVWPGRRLRQPCSAKAEEPRQLLGAAKDDGGYRLHERSSEVHRLGLLPVKAETAGALRLQRSSPRNL
jgi:hypothetical protein